jgi:hypothetical protein
MSGKRNREMKANRKIQVCRKARRSSRCSGPFAFRQARPLPKSFRVNNHHPIYRHQKSPLIRRDYFKDCLLCLHAMSDNHERIAPVTNTNDTSSRGANPDKIGVYSTDRDATTASTTSSATASPSMAGTTTAGDANRRASAATAASPARWIIPAVVVVLIILALLYLF